MNEIRNGRSFAKIIERVCKSYIVVGVTLSPEIKREATTSGRDNYSFAVAELNQSTPSDIVNTLENSAKENFKNIYRNFSDKDSVTPVNESAKSEVTSQLTPTTPASRQAPVAEAPKVEALKDVESTKEALTGATFGANFNLSLEQSETPRQVSEAYHKAKADGSNPELVQAVEGLLAPKTETLTPNTQTNERQGNNQQEAGSGQEGTAASKVGNGESRTAEEVVTPKPTTDESTKVEGAQQVEPVQKGGEGRVGDGAELAAEDRGRQEGGADKGKAASAVPTVIFHATEAKFEGLPKKVSGGKTGTFNEPAGIYYSTNPKAAQKATGKTGEQRVVEAEFKPKNPLVIADDRTDEIYNAAMDKAEADVREQLGDEEFDIREQGQDE